MKKAEWRIPDTFMKMNRSHTVPLSKQALRVLQIMEPVSRHRPWVFPSIRKPLEHMHQQTANAALIRMGFGGELVAHGMRSIARTAGAGHFPREVLESALAHQKEDEIEAAYNRSDYLEQRRPLMQWWGNYVDAARRQALLGEEEPLRIVEGE
ncbi:TPA: tyrosine-type recombinase/integrase [Citrobacter koseri]|nr:tyrosine-type recombinase/integrase [Escherichia coli]HBC7344696.1 tyrosine-type recombinase/integrase [Citrobacter koseri]